MFQLGAGHYIKEYISIMAHLKHVSRLTFAGDSGHRNI